MIISRQLTVGDEARNRRHARARYPAPLLHDGIKVGLPDIQSFQPRPALQKRIQRLAEARVVHPGVRRQVENSETSSIQEERPQSREGGEVHVRASELHAPQLAAPEEAGQARHVRRGHASLEDDRLHVRRPLQRGSERADGVEEARVGGSLEAQPQAAYRPSRLTYRRPQCGQVVVSLLGETPGEEEADVQRVEGVLGEGREVVPRILRHERHGRYSTATAVLSRKCAPANSTQLNSTRKCAMYRNNTHQSWRTVAPLLPPSHIPSLG